MTRLTFVFALVLTCAACATSTRPKANLAIDSEPTPPPAATSQAEPTAMSDEEYSEDAIDLGLEGSSSGPVRIEAAMSEEGEETALASQRGSDTKKKKSSDDDIEEDEDEESDSDSEDDEETEE